MLSEVPDRIGSYVTTREIGRGGMGVVLLARDESLDREVAIKCLPGELAHDGERLAMITREAKLLASLNHPNIATIHDLAQLDGRVYLVLEYIGGESLPDFLGQQDATWRSLLEVALPLAEALSVAHARGIVHCDIKPDNVRFTDSGVVKLLDFGLARVIANPAVPHHDATTVTHDPTPTSGMGTPGYMAPEQLRGAPADARSDIFSFGCLLHEMLTGRKTFKRETPADTMAATLKERPDPPSRCGAQVPAEFDRIVMRCLEKQPEDRFQSAHDLAIALRRLLTGEQRGPSRFARPVASGLLLAALLVGGVWVAAGGLVNDTARAPPRIGVFPFQYEEAEAESAYLAQEIPAIAIDGLSTLSSVHVIPRSTTFRHRDPDADLLQLGQELGADAILTGWLDERGGKLFVHAELLDVATGRQRWSKRYEHSLEDTLLVERDMTRRIVQALQLELTGEEEARLSDRRPTNSDAHVAYLEGQYWAFSRDKPGLRRSIELYEKAIESDPGYALAYAGKANAYALLALGLAQAPSELMPQAKVAAAKAVELGGHLAEVHTTLGLIRWLWDWDFAGAAAELEQAIEIKPRYAEAYHWLAHVRASQGRYPEAMTAEQTARRLEPQTRHYNSCLGHFHAWNGQPELSLRQLEHTVEMDSSFGLARVYLARELVAQGRPAEGLPHLLRLRAEGQRLGDASGDLGWAYAEAGLRKDALDVLRRLGQRDEDGYVPRIAFARIHAGLRDAEETLRWLQLAVDEREAVMPLIKSEPHFDFLQGDPRFAEILGKVGLDH